MDERSSGTFVPPRVWTARHVGLSYTLKKGRGSIHGAGRLPDRHGNCVTQTTASSTKAEDGAAMTLIETSKPLAARYAIALWFGASILFWLSAAAVAINF
jgi:hypothetical protein